MKKLFLIGGGGHCASCIDVIEESKMYQISGIFDMPDKVGQNLLGYPVLGSDDDLKKYVQPDHFFLITIGQIKTPDVRISKFQMLKNLGAQFATVISPRAYVSKHAVIGAGSIVMHDALVNSKAQIGENCIINTKALIEHDAVIADHCHVATAAVVNGACSVGEGSFIGSNSVLREAVNVPSRTVLSAGVFLK